MKKIATHNLIVTTIIVPLLVIAGCTTALAQPELLTGQTTPQTTHLPSASVSVNEADIQRVTVSNDDRRAITGQLDGSSTFPSQTLHERIPIAVESNTTANITIRTETQRPSVLLRGPDGYIRPDASNSFTNVTRFGLVNFSDGDVYTIMVLSSGRNEDYDVTIQPGVDPLFFDDVENWNTTERYLEFGLDYANAGQPVTDNATFLRPTTYLEHDSVVITYEMEPEATRMERIDIDATLTTLYTNLYRQYRSESDSPFDLTWVPDRVYHRAVTPDGELYRTTFLELEWARDYAQDSDSLQYFSRYIRTILFGPANQQYQEGEQNSTTDATFPQAYADIDHLPENVTGTFADNMDEDCLPTNSSSTIEGQSLESSVCRVE